MNGQDRNERLRRAAIAGAVVALTVSLSGCLPNTSQPWFTTPIEWSGGDRYVEDPTGPQHEDLTTTVRLIDGQRARLVDFPQGTTRTDDNGDLCLDVSGTARYTGEATWSVRNGYTIVLTFGDSSVFVSANAGRFAKQDWTALGFDECGDGAIWSIGYACGNSGYGGPGESGAFRERCQDT